MFVGHYGPAFALKAWQPKTPLLALMLGVQLVDVAWSVFVTTGIEEMRVVPGITASNALDLVYMPYTHGLVAVVLWALAAGIAMAVARGRGVGVAVALAVASHWVLDLVVHRPDLPIYGDRWKVGLGLWNHPAVALPLELATLVGGLALYLRATRPLDRIGRLGPWLLAVALAGMQAFQTFGPPPPTVIATAGAALGSYLAVAFVAAWIDRHRA